jgi:hypothetical protein
MTITNPQQTVNPSTSEHTMRITTIDHTSTTCADDLARQLGPPAVRLHWTWLTVWAVLTTFAVFEIVKHGYVNGTAIDAVLLTAIAVGFFVAPDLTFLIGAGQTTAKGSLPTRAVPWYNRMHRMWIPLTLTSIIGIALAPLAIVPLAGFIGGLSWMAHIALDRAAGYGLRNPDGSRDRS